MPTSKREEELQVRHLLASQQVIADVVKAKNWELLLALQMYANKDAPTSLIGTDAALYRTLRYQITMYRLRWNFNTTKLERLIAKSKTKISQKVP